MKRRSEGSVKSGKSNPVYSVRDILVWTFMAVMVIYPLYMKKGFVKLATAKKEFYYLASCILVIPGIVLSLAGFLAGAKNKFKDLISRITLPDWFAFGYLLILLISTLTSPYSDNAMTGSSGWYTGFTTQLLFLLSFFLISHSVKFSEKWLLCLFGVSAVIYILCVLARFHVNVFGLYDGRNEDFWNAYIPTIGQKNWYACFLVIVFPLELGYFLVRKNELHDIWLIPLIAIGTMAMVMQDSDSIYVGMLFVLLYLFEMFCNDLKGLKRFFLMLSIIFVSLQILGIIQMIFRDDLVKLSSMVTTVTGNPYIRAVGFAALAIWVVLELLSEKMDEKKVLEASKFIRMAKRIILILAAATIIILIVLMILVTNFSDSFDFGSLSKSKYFMFDNDWGTYRGINWMTALTCFGELNLWQKLFGIGPDCYYSYVSLYHPDFTAIWSGAISNAHNEFLTALVNTGILGAICYYGIFISLLYKAFKQRKKSPMLLVLTAGIVGFLFNNIFSFMNIISTPLLFVIAACANSLPNSQE